MYMVQRTMQRVSKKGGSCIVHTPKGDMSVSARRLQRCPRLQQILATGTCNKILTQDTYYDFQSQYMNQFLFHLLESENACLAGDIKIAVNEFAPDRYDRAQIMESRLALQRCAQLDRLVVIVSSYFARFDFSRVPRAADGRGPTLNPPQAVADDLRAQYDSDPDKSAHFTVLFIDNRARTVEYFESNGSETPWLPPTVVELKRILASFAQSSRVRAASARTRTGADQWTTYEFIEPGDFCPRISWQTLSDTQKCAYWGTLFAVLRLSCPELSRAQLVDAVLEPGKDFLLNLLDKFHCYMWNYIDRTGILAIKRLLDGTSKWIDTERKSGTLEKVTGADRNDAVVIVNALVAAFNEAQRVWNQYFDVKGTRAALAPMVLGLQAVTRAAPQLTCAQFQQAKDRLIALAPVPSNVTRTGRQVSETEAASLPSYRDLRSARLPAPNQLPALVQFLNKSIAANKQAAQRAAMERKAPSSTPLGINELLDTYQDRHASGDFYKLGPKGSKTSVEIGNYIGVDRYNTALDLHQRQRNTPAAQAVLHTALAQFDALAAAFPTTPCRTFAEAARLFTIGRGQEAVQLLQNQGGR